MRYLVVLIFGPLAASLSVHRSNECNSKIDPTLIVDEFNNGMRSVHELPIFESGDNKTIEFVKLFIIATKNLGGGVEGNLYVQVQEGSEDLIRNITKYSDELWKAVEAVEPDKEDYYLDDYLTSLTDQSNIFLDLAPGTSLVKRLKLPKMPKLGTGFQKYEQKRTINELFLNLGEILDQDMFRGIEFIIELLREGWKHGRLSLETTQAQHRDVFLNGQVLPVYAEVAEKVFKESDLIKRHVRKETWEAFEEAGNNIISDYEDYIKSKINTNCNERV